MILKGDKKWNRSYLMNIINIEHISKIYGDKAIFNGASVGIHEGDKIGIVGINGTGKTTLLKLICDMEYPDSGQIVKQNGVKIAYLPQNPSFPNEATVASYALSGNPELDWMIQSNLTKLGITEYDTKIEYLSGGQKKKVAMAKCLVAGADILLLDEPTNHLDGDMIDWLESYLKNFRGTILMVTHDRYFLDMVTNRILEISYGQIYSYEANYSTFLEMKVQREEMEMASERKRQSVLRMELEWAKRGCRARSTKQRARLERLEALKSGSAPVKEQNVELESVETRMGKKTVELHHISKSYGDKTLIADFDYIVLKNQRLGFIGPNGCGKSTLLKIMAGLIQPDDGHVEVGETIKMGYFAQEVPNMDTEQRVIDYVKDIAEYIPTRDGKITASQMLERFLFAPDMQYAPINKLSGGEKKRLYLLGILQSGPNFLVLDEASNDIDIPTMTILEEYLTTFPGIVVTVSHDRYFLDNVVDRIFEFDGAGHLKQYEGGYTEYLELKQRQTELEDLTGEGAAKADNAEKGTGNKAWKQSAPAKLKFSYKEQKEFETIDDDIAALEEKLEKLDVDIMANATNSMRLSQLMEEKLQLEKQLEEKTERWMYLSELEEQIEAQKTAN